MTLRTLYASIEMINVRTHNEYAKQAALKGIKIETKKIKREFEPIDQKVKTTLAKLHQEAIARKVKEKTEKRGGKR